MPLRVHVKTGYGSVTPEYAVKRLRDIAKRYPDDSLVQRTLAEAEFDADNYVEAEAAADAALKVDPQSVEAKVYKGRAILARGKKANDAKLFAEARRHFLAANKLDNEDPEPLYLYYRTYRATNATAPKSAVDALSYASILAPQDSYLAIQLTREHLRHNDLKAAAEALKPIAYAPHAGQSKRNEVLTVLRMIEDGKGKEAADKIDEDLKKLVVKEKN